MNIMKYVFLVKYEQIWEDGDETSGEMRVSVDDYDAQDAIGKVREMVIGEEGNCMTPNGNKLVRCNDVRVVGVQFVTDYYELAEVTVK